MTCKFLPRYSRARIWLAVVFSLLVCARAGADEFAPSGPWGWWPDPATQRGLSVWISYSNQYDSWRDPDYLEEQLTALGREGVEVVFVALRSGAPPDNHLQALSDRSDPFTLDVQAFLNRLDGQGIAACAAIFSDAFVGSDAQMGRYVLADHLADFNRDRGPDDAPFRCVATDLEMGRGARNTFVYDRWKEFHLNLRDRIAPPASEMQLLVWMQGPDFLLDQMDSSDDRETLMMRENISRDDQDPTLYHGALRYFTVQDDAPIFDALVPMWYFRTLGPYQRRVEHNLRELHKLDFEALYLIGGFMVRNEQHGLCCPDCVNGRAGYEERLAYNDSVRDGDLSFIGSGVFKWPVPEDWVCGR